MKTLIDKVYDIDRLIYGTCPRDRHPVVSGRAMDSWLAAAIRRGPVYVGDNFCIFYNNFIRTFMTQKEIFDLMLSNPKFGDILPTEKLVSFASYAADGSTMDLRETLRQIAEGFIEKCGISGVARTLYLNAGEVVFQEFIQSDTPLAQTIKADGRSKFIDCMDRFTDEYDKAECDGYSLVALLFDEYLIYCMDECSYNIPQKRKEALCYGVLLMILNDRI